MRRNRIIYYILCISALVLASFYGGPISYSLLFGLILIAPVSFAYLLTVYLFFRIYQVVQGKHITAYEPVPYYFVLKNEYLLNFCHIKTSMYSTFSYIEKMPEDKEYELLPNESARYDTKLICRYRGNYCVGIKDITITDYLKLFSITYHVPEPIDVQVVPRIIELPSLSVDNEQARNSYKENSRLKQDFDAAVRDYIPGDPPKGIHRKLSAKTGMLKSRLTFGEERQGIAIFLDTDRVSDDEYEFIPVENKALEIVLALVDYYAKRSIMSTLRFYRPGSAGNSVHSRNYGRNDAGAGNTGNSMYTGSYGRNNVGAGSSGISGAGLEEIKCTGVNGMEAFLAQVSAIQFRNTPESSAVAGMISQDPVFRNSLVVFMVVTGSCRELNETLNELSLSGVTTVIYYVGYEPDTGSILALQNQTIIPVHPEDDLVSVMQ